MPSNQPTRPRSLGFSELPPEYANSQDDYATRVNDITFAAAAIAAPSRPADLAEQYRQNMLLMLQRALRERAGSPSCKPVEAKKRHRNSDDDDESIGILKSPRHDQFTNNRCKV